MPAICPLWESATVSVSHQCPSRAHTTIGAYLRSRYEAESTDILRETIVETGL